MRVITSFSQKGYEQYGKRMLESYVKYCTVPISVYYEEKQPDFQHPLVSYESLFDIDGMSNFLDRANFPAMKGQFHGKYNYRYNIFAFCRKSFAQIHAAAEYQHGQLFWLDGDTELTDWLTKAKLEKMLHNTFMCYMDRPSWHSCASFVGWNLDHPQSSEFWSTYFDLYWSGNVFVLPEWHDSYVLDQLRLGLKLEARDLAEGLVLEDGPVNVFNHVFEGVAKHYKGNLKKVA